MKTVCRFEKVPYYEFEKAFLKYYKCENSSFIKLIYDEIKLPQRSTNRSSGYDFFAPYQFSIHAGKSVIVPTGIRCVFFEDGYDLSIYPRSGLGFKYGIALANTVGIIDNDYFEADNFGHIMIKLTVPESLSINSLGSTINYVHINTSEAFAQGIIREFFLAEGDEDVEKQQRTGGFGSTDKNK